MGDSDVRAWAVAPERGHLPPLLELSGHGEIERVARLDTIPVP